MKRIFIIIVAIAITILLVGCGLAQEVSRVPVDCRYTPGHTEIVTETKYEYNLLKGEFQLVPYTKSKWVDDAYQVKSRITYDDGTTRYQWKSVGKADYEAVKGAKTDENAESD